MRVASELPARSLARCDHGDDDAVDRGSQLANMDDRVGRNLTKTLSFAP